MGTEFKGCKHLQGMVCGAVPMWLNAVKTPSVALEKSNGFSQVAEALDGLGKGVDWQDAGGGAKAIAMVLQAREQIKDTPPVVTGGDLCGRVTRCPFYSPFPDPK